MARNIEIKARIESVESVACVVAPLATAGPSLIQQDDTFFRCDRGRLKLRAFSGSEGELIFYQRDDVAEPKASFYVRSPTSSPDTLRDALARAYGETGRVRKRRTLYMIGRTRVHLDRVEGLGDFLELEVVLEEGEGVQAGVVEARRLMSALGIAASQQVAGAYVDLIGAATEGV